MLFLWKPIISKSPYLCFSTAKNIVIELNPIESILGIWGNGNTETRETFYLMFYIGAQQFGHLIVYAFLKVWKFSSFK